MTKKYSDYIIYVDESGDANWSISQEFPVLCLNFCIFHKEEYIKKIIPAFNALKFKYWGTDNIVFHERDFRKTDKMTDKPMRSKYEMLVGEIRENFMQELSEAIAEAQFHIFAVLIDKREFSEDYKEYDPYHICLSRGLRQIHDFLYNQSPEHLAKDTHFIFEKRGDKEDRELSSAFQKIKIEGALLGGFKEYNFENFYSELMSKQVNSTGLQIADLTARPIANHYLNKTKNDRAFNAIKEKLHFCKRDSCSIGGYDIVHQSFEKTKSP